MSLDPLLAISALDGRYRSKVEPLAECLSEYGLLHARVEVECRWFKALAESDEVTDLPALSDAQVQDIDAIVTEFSLADAARRMEDIDIYSLVYSRGYLVASLLDREMELHCGPGTFEAALRDLFQQKSYYRTGEVVSPSVVRDIFVSHCEIAGDLIDRYAEGVEVPPLPSSDRRFSVAVQ